MLRHAAILADRGGVPKHALRDIASFRKGKYAPERLGEFRIEPGKPCVAKYRFVAAEGEVDRAGIDHPWNDYAKPPGVEVK